MFDTIQAFLRGVRIGYSHHVDGEKPPEIVIRRREQTSYPIFRGLAISLLFGLLSAALLTLLVIQAIHVLLREEAHNDARRAHADG